MSEKIEAVASIETLDDFPSFVGREFVGQWQIQSKDRHISFYHGTYLDEAYGPTLEGYDEDLVEGLHQVGMLDWLTASIVGRWYGFNYGFNKVRFVSQLKLGQRIRLRLVILSAVKRGDGYLVTYKSQLEAEGSDRPSMVAEWLVLLLPKPSVSAKSV